MNGWKQSIWGDEISLEYGKAIRGYQDGQSGYRVYGTNGPVGWTSTPLTDGPGVILGRKGAYRGVHFSQDPFFVIDTAYYVKPKSDQIDMRWLFYAIKYHKLGEIDDGSPIPSTTRSAVYVRELDVPPKAQQEQMASILGALDDKIELNRRMNESLEAMARAIFKDWFVDFGPTRAKMEGRAPYLAPDLWALFPDRLDAEEKPEGWRTGTLEDLLVLQRGFDLPAAQRGAGQYSVVAASGHNGYHDHFMVKGPGVTTGRSGVIGQVFFVHDDFWPLNTSLWVKDYKASSPYHAYFILKALDLAQFNAGSAVPTLNRNHIHNLPQVVAPDSVLKAFNESASSLFAKLKSGTAENQVLAQTRDLLLPKLMSGEIRIKDAEGIVGAGL